jgi:hypothetical protein
VVIPQRKATPWSLPDWFGCLKETFRRLRELLKSAASRRFVALSAARMQDWMASDLSGLNLLVIRIYGVAMDEDLILVAAIGVDAKGDQHPLGLTEAPRRPHTVPVAMTAISAIGGPSESRPSAPARREARPGARGHRRREGAGQLAARITRWWSSRIRR